MATKEQPKEKAPDGPKTCFVVSPIGEEGSPIRRHADQLLKHIIRPVVEPFGYRVVRADDIAEPGLITHQIVEQLIDADLVVADLTEHNPNVFYELALRHGLMKPVVQMIHVGQKLPFDVAGARAIFFDLGDLDAAEAAREALRKQVEAVEGKAPVSNPFSVVFELRRLSGSEDPEDQFKATVLEALQDLQNRFEQGLSLTARQRLVAEKEDVELAINLKLLHGQGKIDDNEFDYSYPPYLRDVKGETMSMVALHKIKKRLESQLARRHDVAMLPLLGSIAT